MLKSIKIFFYTLLDTILPERVNFSVVKNLDEETINNLPRANPVEGMDFIHPLFHYKDNRVRAIIWELKYKENTLPLPHIGKILYEEIIDLTSDILLFNSDAEFILIPIPITNERRGERGYNQSEYIAKAILENDAHHFLLYAPQWFTKIKDTPKQSQKQTKLERMEDLDGCFSADLNVSGKYIILIDDVVTTGSTLSEASRELLSAGAREVFAFTIAH